MKVVVTSPFDLNEEQRARLEACGEVRYYDTEPASAEEWLKRCEGFSFVCSGKAGMTMPMQGSDSTDFGIYHLEADTTVSFPFVNVGMIITERLQQARVQLGYAPGCNRKAVAEWVIWMLIAHFREFLGAVNADGSGPQLKRTRSLLGKKITVLGMGAVGKEVEQLARSHEMEVTCFRRGDDLFKSVAEADAVVNCLSSDPANSGLLNGNFFAAMRQGSFFVTMTNPAIWSIDALKEALSSGHLEGAAIDIGNRGPGDTEAPTYQQVMGMSQVLATPQIAHYADTSAQTSFAMMIENIEAGIQGRKLPYAWN